MKLLKKKKSNAQFNWILEKEKKVIHKQNAKISFISLMDLLFPWKLQIITRENIYKNKLELMNRIYYSVKNTSGNFSVIS